MSRPSAKAQVLADFIIELSPELESDLAPLEKSWELHVDGSSSQQGYAIRIRLRSPTGELLEQSFRLEFPASNNEDEYEALLAGLRLAKAIGARKIHTFCDSQLIASKLSGDYEAKNDWMDAYLKIVHKLANKFETFELTKIPRSDNTPADALAVLTSASDPVLKRTIPVESILEPNIQRTREVIYAIDNNTDDAAEMSDDVPVTDIIDPNVDWRDEIRNYISNGTARQISGHHDV